MFVLYDSMRNSVFQSQVLQPLLARLKEDKNLAVTLVSFERKHDLSQARDISSLISHDRLDIKLCPKSFFLCKVSLLFAGQKLKKIILDRLPDSIIARGPLAGFIVKHTQRNNKLFKDITVTVQARGLCEQEYRYTQTYKQSKNKIFAFLKNIVTRVRYAQLARIEQTVFGDYQEAHIESVSPALKDYLVKEFNARSENISIAQKDIPERIKQEQVKAWRELIRNKLGIASDAQVYCYSGSFRPWQCVEETIAYFAREYKKNYKSFMLVFSQDKEPFIHELKKHGISSQRYNVLSISPVELCKYLACSDYGFLLREPDIINWVSRPTKMLEYQAVGLKIIHNDTVAWIAQNKGK